MKKSVIINTALLAIFTILIARSAVHAQLFPYTGTTVQPASSTMSATTTTSSTSNAPSSTSPLPVPVVEPSTSTTTTTSITTTTVVPVVVATPASGSSGYMQFNDLTVQSITNSSSSMSASMLPATVVATLNGQTYNITVDAATQVLFSDRSTATLA